MPDRSLTDIHATQLRRRVATVAASLRRLADTIEREAAHLPDTPGATVSFASVVASIQHEVSWGVANLNLSSLTCDAAEADRTRKEG